MKMNKFVRKGVLVGLCTLICTTFVGCNEGKKLSELGYSEVSCDNIVKESYVNDIIDNKISSETLDDMKKQQYYKEEDLDIYCNLLNRVYNAEDYDIMMKGIEVLNNNKVDVSELIKQDKEKIKETIDNQLKPSLEISNEITVTQKNEGVAYLKSQVNAVSYFDEDIKDKVEVTGDFDSSKLGKQKIDLTISDSKGYTNKKSIEIEVKDNLEPTLNFENDILGSKGEEIDYVKNVTAVDNYDGDITDKIVVNSDGVDINKAGKYQIEYSVTDSTGNKATAIRNVEITNSVELGQTFTINNYDITMNSFNYNKKDSEPAKILYSYCTADEGQTYLITKLSISNKANEARTPFTIYGNEKNMLYAQLIYDDQYVYNNCANSLENNWFYSLNSSVKPLTTKTKNLTFEVPEEVSSSDKSVVIKIYKYDDENDFVLIKLK